MQEAERRPGTPKDCFWAVSAQAEERNPHSDNSAAHGIQSCPGQADPTHPLPDTWPGFLPGPVRSIPSCHCGEWSSLSSAGTSFMWRGEGGAWAAACRGVILINLFRRDYELLHE